MSLELGDILAFVFVAYSIILHEIAHAYAALRFGDPTARAQGRLSLSPVSHIDPVGTILFPALQLLSTGRVFIGWARPVPVNYYNLRPRVAGDVVVSLAGIAVNLLLAVLAAVGLGLLGVDLFALQLGAGPSESELHRAVYWTMFANLGLALFNLLPIPPLDGSHVMKYLLPRELRAGYERIGFFGIWILLVLIATDLVWRVLAPPLLWLLMRLLDLVVLVQGGPIPA
ncbi:MAG: site-2 protease family protein [Planctomycetota bacterium]|nr:MAG: site-2 protease family protein [Planctomycetota bacterium]